MGGATCSKTPISRSALEENTIPGHLFEGNLVDEGTTGRSTDAPVHLRKTRRFHTHHENGVILEQLEM